MVGATTATASHARHLRAGSENSEINDNRKADYHQSIYPSTEKTIGGQEGHIRSTDPLDRMWPKEGQRI